MFIYKFVAIQRTDRTNTIVKLSVTANTEHDARYQFARQYILFLSARIKKEEIHVYTV